MSTLSSMEAFISGHSVVTPSGTFAVNQNPRRPSDESSSNSNSRSNNRNGNGSGGDNGNVVLAERTNQLMSSYRDFISGQEDEEMLVQRVYGDGNGNTTTATNTSSGHSSSTIRRGNNSNNNEQHGGYNHGGYSDSNTNLYTGAPLLRGWGTSRCELNMEEESDDWDNGSLDSWEKKNRYTHPIYHSKKFKKFMLAVLVAGALVGTVGVIVKSSSKNSKGDNNDSNSSGDVMNVDKLASEGGDWNAEMKEAILQEEEDKEARLESGVEKAAATSASASMANALNAQTIGIAAINDVNMDRPPEVEEDDKEEESDEEEGGQGGDKDAAAAAANAIPSFTIQEEEENEDEPKNKNENDTADKLSQAPDTPTTKNQQQVDNLIATAKTIGEEHIAALSGNGIEALTRHVLCCSSSPSTNAKTNTRGGAAASQNQNIAAREYAHAESYHPTWYNRQNGWMGSTYNQALDFCSSQTEPNSKVSLELCPYEVYCPTGPHHIPLGGYRTEETDGVNDGNDNDGNGTTNAKESGSGGGGSVVRSSRSPIKDMANGWVQVGMENVCVQYTIVTTDDEEGEDDKDKEGGDEEEVVEVVEDEQEEKKEDDAKEIVEQVIQDKSAETEDLNAGADEEEKTTEEAPVAAAATTTTTVNGSMGGSNLGGPSAMTEELVAKGNENEQQQQQKDPEEDQQQQQQQQQSTAAEISSKTPQQQAQATQQQVQTQSTSHGAPRPGRAPIDIPASESSLSANAVANAAAAAAASNTATTTSTTTTTSKINMTKILHAKFKPMWLSAKEGWNGGSHSDAIEFCKSIRGKRLCPYSAMCPHGPGNEVMGGRHRLEFVVNGEQYAPVLGGENHWVMVGNNGEADHKCKTHRQLEGHVPAWGLNGDNKEIKQHVMCCTVE